MSDHHKHSAGAVTRKILAAFILVSIAIALALAIARFSYRELMSTVDDLSEPNEKLTILNSLFEEITTLDQLQRAEAIKNPHKPYNSFLEQSVSLNAMIDSLRSLPWDTSQMNRLEEMKEILKQRNELFFSYLKVKAELLDNRDFSIQLDTLEAILQNDNLAIDSSIITTRKKVTTTYLPDTVSLKKKDQRSAIRKLFSKKKNKIPADTPRIKVQEELSVVVDTLALARQNEAVKEIEKIMREMEIDQRVQRKKLQRQELELINSNSLFITQLLNILHTVENEELVQMRENNAHAVKVMSQSISRTNILMLAFFVAAALLVYLIWIDITRSNYYKEQLEQARDQAEELGKIKQRFLANMSHEIRTPLQSIIGFAEQLKLKSANKHEEVEAIHSSSEHLLQIVNEVLDYSRISSGTFTLANERFKLFAVIKEVEAAMRVQADSKRLLFVLDSEKASDYVLTGDPFRLRQILYNIIGNAIKFTHKGFIKLAIKTTPEGDHVRCFFEITDSGIGIDKQDLDRIFNQFEQANSSIAKNYGGTGLGLTIVKSLIDAQGGNLQVSSDPGSGSCFRFELRFAKALHNPEQAIQPSKRDTSPGNKSKVMVVDDDALILRLCSLILKKNHIQHITFDTPRSILQQSPDDEVSHIFLDIRMPEMNGADLCRELRKKYQPSTRFIALTAHVLPEEKESLLKNGFDAILTKPFHENELLNMIGILTTDETIQSVEQPNLSTLKEMTMGDDVLFHSIINQFMEETESDLIKARESLVKKNPKTLREVVHKMAGRFAQVGMLALSANLHAIEKQLVDGTPLTNFMDEAQMTMKKVENSLARIKLTTMEHLS
jgi:signal transduction histidine kinase/FixJ family two-component response regulator